MSIAHLLTADRPAILAALTALEAQRFGAEWTAADNAAMMADRRSVGLLLNSVVHHPLHDYGAAIPAAERKAAKKLLTAADRAALRTGG